MKNHDPEDRDGSSHALHHTLGPGANQAAPGNHSHDGGASTTLDIIQSTPLDSITDLNTLTTTGIYFQQFDANATLALHYPVGATGAGFLEVNSGYGFQRYTTYRGGGVRVFVRDFYASSWGAWNQLQLIEDTSWIACTLNTGWSVGSESPMYRRKNGITYLHGRGTSIGVSATAFTLPVGFRFSASKILMAEATGMSVRCQVLASGVVGQVVAAAVTNLSFGSFPPFPADL